MTDVFAKDLVPGTNYAVQVRSVSGGQTSEWSPVYNFTTETTGSTPKTPTGVVVTSIGDAFHVEWTSVTENLSNETIAVSRYEIELTGTPTTVVAFKSVPQATETTVKLDLTFEENAQLFGVAKSGLSVRVRAVDNAESKSAWSTATTVVSNPAPATPTGLSASGGFDSVTVQWDANSDIDILGYRLQVSKNNGSPGSWTTIYQGPNTAFTYASNTYTTDHWFQLHAIDKFSTFSASSQVTGSAVRPTQGSVVDTAAPNNVTSFTGTPGWDVTRTESYISLNWTAATPLTPISHHEIRYGTDGSTWRYLTAPRDAAGTNAARIGNLKQNTAYHIGIRTVNFYGVASSWLSITGNPITSGTNASAPSQPAAPTVAGNTLQLQVTVSGNKQAGGAMESDVTHYEVYASTTNNFSTYDAPTRLGTIPVGPAMIETFDVPAGAGSGSGQTWYCKIIAVNVANLKSSASPQNSDTVDLIASANISDLAVTNAKINDLSATKITAGTINTGDITVKSKLIIGDATTQGEISSFGYVADTTGFKISKDGIEINDGAIKAEALLIQSSNNIIQVEYAGFEFAPAFYFEPGVLDIPAGLTVTVDDTISKFESQSLKCVTGGSALNIGFGPIGQAGTIISEEGEYIVSAWVRSSNTSSLHLRAATTTDANANISAWQDETKTIAAANVWEQIYMTVNFSFATLVSGTTQIAITVPASTTLHIDGLQIEKKVSATDVPSPWSPPGTTSINAGMIRTGALVSTNYIEGQSGWKIDIDGSAEFRNLAAESIAGGVYSGDMILEGSITAFGPRGESVGFNADGFLVRGPNEVSIVNKELTSNVATITTVDDHGFTAGNEVNIVGVDATFNGQFTIDTIPTSTTFTYALVAADVASAASGGIAQSLDSTGMHNGTELVNFPTDGSNPNIISGNLTAGTLVVTDAGSLSGQIDVQTNATIKLLTGPQAPTSKPTVSFDRNEVTFTGGHIASGMYGVTKGHNGNWFIICGQHYVDEFTTTGAFVTTHYTNTDRFLRSIYWSDTYSRYYIKTTKEVSSGSLGRPTIQYQATVRVFSSSFVQQAEVAQGPATSTSTPAYSACIGWDYAADRLIFASPGKGTSDGVLVQVCNMGGTGIPTGTYAAELTLAGSSGSSTASSINRLAGDLPALSYVYSDSGSWSGNINVYDTSGTRVIDYEWPKGNGNITGVTYTNSKFYSVGQTSGKLYEYQGGEAYWSTATAPTQWVAYAYRDSNSSNTTKTITNKALTSNVATITTSTTHGYITGDIVEIENVDATFNGRYTITSTPTTTTFTYAKTASNVTSVADTGTARLNVYETTLGPALKYTPTKRTRMKVSISSIPIGDGGVDDPNSAKIFVANTTSEPSKTSTSWKARTIITYPLTSANISSTQVTTDLMTPYATNTFNAVAGAPGKLIGGDTGQYNISGDGTGVWKQLHLNSTTTPATSAGNSPALRVGSTSGGHLRIGNTQIIAMANDTTQADLSLNSGGRVSNATLLSPNVHGRTTISNTSGDARGSIAGVTVGRVISVNTNANSEVVVNHGLGTTPSVVLAACVSNHQVTVEGRSTTQLTLEFRTPAGVLVGSGVAVSADWMAFLD